MVKEPVKISVIIPTTRSDSLKLVMAALGKQSVQNFETVIVEDKTRRGPAWARNRGIELSLGEIVVFIGDDTIPHPNFLQSHLDVHHQFSQSNYAVMGKVRWHRSHRNSRFHRWLERSGMQNDYREMIERQPVPATRFYTGNLSLKRKFLAETKLKFDEDITVPALEDIEFGIRFNAAGGKAIFAPGSLVYHRHEMQPAEFFVKMYRSGRAGAHLYQRYPKFKERIFPTQIHIKEQVRLAGWQVLYPLGRILGIEKILQENWQRLATYAIIKGYRDEIRKLNE